jgi:hypothetical protein
VKAPLIKSRAELLFGLTAMTADLQFAKADYHPLVGATVDELRSVQMPAYQEYSASGDTNCLRLSVTTRRLMNLTLL